MGRDEFEVGTTFSQNRKAEDGLGLSTPHRSKRVNLGTPANYYFKYMNSTKKSATKELTIRQDDENEDTGTISIPGFRIGGGNLQTETSFFSMAGSSTSSEGSGDILNKSTLSDTTELTASNFVLVTTSKQTMIQQTRDHCTPAKDKENAENRKCDSNSSKSVAMNRKDNAAVDDKKTIVDGNMAETAKEPETSSLTNQTEEMHGVLQQRSVHYTSPSIRSRFSASPTSLRKFHENLKNSRIKRQQQREEDMKRRLSVEGNNTLDSMNAQLQALTNHGALTKKRLPPPFTQLSQQSLSQESIVASTDQFSPSESSTDGTVTINMADLDDLLGIKTSGRRENQSSITAHQSAVQHALNDENSATSQGRDQTSTLEFLAKYRVNGIVNSSMPSKLSPVTGDSKKINESNIQSNPSSSDSELKCLSPHNSTVASLKLRSASSNPRKRMTPSKLSSTPQRVVNPMSIFSPASNTRSAKKRRKLLEEQEKSNPASVENALVERKEPSPKIGICLFHEASTTGHDSSIDSESSAAATGADHDRGAFESHPAHDGDTASLGDIADVFGMENTTDGISFGEVSVQSNQHARKEKDPLSDGQETASMANIDDSIKEGFPLSYESSSRDSIQKPQTIADKGGRFSQGLPTKERDLRGDGQETASISDFDDLVKQGFIPSNKFSLRETLDEPDMGTGEISKISQGLSDKESDLQGESQEMTSTSRSNAFKEQKSPPRNGTSGRERCEQPHISNDNIRRKSKDSTSNSTSESHDNKDSGKDKILVANDVDHSFSLIASKSSLVEKEEHEPSGSETDTFTSGKDPMLEKYDSPTPRSGSDMLCTPPDIQTASFESTAIPSRSFDRNSHLMNLFPKSPIQMTPSNHKKPTPSKLAPSPRRVMNPMNPNSPARNTRSSLKKILPTDGSGLKSILGGEPRQNCALTREQQDNDGNHGVLRCSKRRQSLCVRPVAEQMEESHSSEQTPFLKPCNGILSSKKKNMLVPKPSTGILSSKKKLFSRRSVAFGSPEAAEYNIGSPSVSLTPMPKGRAKALFTLPATYSSSCSNQVDTCDAGIDESECAGNKSGVDLLVDKITVKLMNNSPELSPIEKKKIDTDAFQVPSHLMPSEDSRLLEDKTVESVTEINGQFSNNSEELKRRKSLSKRPSENKENSAELTDSENIASIYSKCHQCTADLSVPIDAQRLDFNDASESSRNNISTKVANEGDSVEIERNMLSSLQDSTEDATLNEDRDRDRNDKSELPSYLASTGTTEIKVMCQRQYRPRQNLNKFQTSKGISENHTEEGDMLSLLQASENHKSTGDSNGDERMDTVENSAIVNEDISEQYTGNLQITSSPRADEDGKTVELEGNMLSLLQASENHKSTGDSNGDERMDTAENSAIVNEDISEQYTGNLQITSSPGADEDGKTVELEGNMLSLLQASENHESTGGSNGDERMDTAENSSTEGEVISLLQAHESRKCQKRGNVTFDRMEVSSESTRFSASSLLGNVSTGGDTIEVDNSNVRDLGGNEKPLNEKNILTDVKGITADSATLVMANESHAQKLNRYQDDESCTRDCPFEVLGESDVAATRRKSLSSNSFTLNRVDHVQNLVNDITIRQTSSNIDKSVSFSDTTEFIKTINVNSGPSDDLLDKPTNVDIASFTSMIFEGLHPVRIQEDGLSDSFTRSGKSNDAVGKIVCDRWRQFIEAVCGEVERRIDQEGTAATSLRSLVEEDPGLYYSIQHRFQSSGEHSVIRESLKRLVEAGQILIGYEWNSWLVTVLESFHGPLTDIPQAFTDDISKIDEALQQSKILETDVSFMNDRRTKRARRKSLARHRTMVTALEREIESIESQLCAIKAELEQMEREKVDLLKATTSCYDFRHNAELHDGLKVEAEISQRSFSSLRGLHSWSVSTLSESDIEISIIGSCKQTYLELMYKGTKCGTANTNVLSKIDSSQKMEKSLYVYHGSIATFLEIATKRLIYMAQKSDIKGEFRINDHLLRYAWLAGRLDIVAKEFQVVQRRYRGKLYRDSKGSFSFIVEFESNKSKMVADFAIESEYPSFPVEVRLDLISGKQDLERIRKALVKNAKPGFGSLSRACDIIHSIMSG